MKSVDLHTPRLHIREFRESDLEDCVAFQRQVFGLEACEARVANWLRWTIDSYRELSQLGQPPYADYAMIARHESRFIGSVGIVPTLVPWGALNGDRDDSRLSPEAGLFWGVMPGFRRRGYASEAGSAMIRFLFEALHLRRVVATTESDNVASRMTMLKLGMALLENPLPEPSWRQVVGYIENPAVG